jgi:hypothetical protein
MQTEASVKAPANHRSNLFNTLHENILKKLQ